MSDYTQPNDWQLNNLHTAMDYDALGRPVLRTTSQASAVVGNTSSDAFGRSRMSMPYTIFDSQSVGTASSRYNFLDTGGGSHYFVASESSNYLEVGTAAGDSVTVQSNTVMAYQPGKSLLTFQSFKFAPPQVGLRQRVGLFDERNGVFLEIDGLDVNLVLRSFSSGAVTEEIYPQSAWEIDQFADFDFSKTNIFWVDLEWLGVGTVRAGFVRDGLPVLGHIIHNNNRRDAVYMTTACLPLRQEITNTAATASGSIAKHICSSAVSEGGLELTGETRVINRDNLTLGALGIEVPLFSARLSPGNNNSVVVPDKFSVFVESQATVRYNVYFGGSALDGTWTTTDPNSSMEYNNTVTAFDVSQARLVRSGFASRGDTVEGGDVKSLIGQFQHLLNGTYPQFLLTVTPYDNNSKIHAWASWVELI